MKLNYVTKIEGNLKNYKRIHTKKMTTRILDGSYKSIYKGRSMNFEDIRDYVSGDDVKDIDWKASARSQKLLVRQYTAEKKHNIMLVLDTNRRMLADTDKLFEKREIGLMGAGTLAYLVNQNGDYISAAYAINMIKEGTDSTSINCTPFRTGLVHVESILQGYYRAVNQGNNSNLDVVLDYIGKNIKRRMIIVVVTDLEGINEIRESTLKRLLIQNDVLAINVKSALLGGARIFDVSRQEYLPSFLADDKRLLNMQTDRYNSMQQSCDNKLKKYAIATASIEDIENLDENIIKLLQR